jgi:hypothetical protein
VRAKDSGRVCVHILHSSHGKFTYAKNATYEASRTDAACNDAGANGSGRSNNRQSRRGASPGLPRIRWRTARAALRGRRGSHRPQSSQRAAAGIPHLLRRISFESNGKSTIQVSAPTCTEHHHQQHHHWRSGATNRRELAPANRSVGSI